MKILVDEMIDGWDEKLTALGYEAYSVRKLNTQGEKLATDYSIINYVKENDMILVTKDKEPAQGCRENGIPCILISDEEIFKIVVNKLNSIT